MEEKRDRAGGPGAGARVLREIIRTPAFRELIKVNSRDLDPDSARELVRTFLWEDVELSLSLVGTVPEVVNYLAAAVLELGMLMRVFPEGLLREYVGQAFAEIDLDVLRRYPETFAPLLESAGFASAAALGFGRAVNATARYVAGVARRNPDFLRDAMSGVDGRLVARAAAAAVRSAARWALGGLRGLLARRLKRAGGRSRARYLSEG